MSYQQLREKFTGFFEQQGHLIVPSSSLVPAEDPTILFTNAGMNQFKDMFLGSQLPLKKRVVTVQRCVRAGGKHNDLENVGYTARHHTFFEMLGNFSFGDYFKERAIEWAYTFVTKEMNLSLEKLWFTVHHSDLESYNIWTQKMGIDPARVITKDDKDNFWAMGDVGPCGPCTEIFYDHGPSVAGGPPGSADEDGDRYMEIWNLVFMQYQRLRDGSLQPLPETCVDTGMGLERLACVQEGVFSNFDTSLFKELKALIKERCPQADNRSLNVLADHLRASVFILSDGITPTADGRGYVLRRLIRRALRHAYQFGVKTPFLQDFVPALTELMGKAYPEIIKQQDFCQQRLLQEQELFFHTLQGGQKYFEQALQREPENISGETLFKLYDTYGFPLDIALDEAKNRDISCDIAGYETQMQEQKKKSRGLQDKPDIEPAHLLDKGAIFVRGVSEISGTITGVYASGKDKTWLGFDQTLFYAEAGGQQADNGSLMVSGASYDVVDVQKFFDHTFVCVTASAESFNKGMLAEQQLDTQRRQNLCAHHTATHLLHAAIHSVLGSGVFQKGSLVAPDRLRFDIAYDKQITAEQMQAIEDFCQKSIDAQETVTTKEMSKEEALKLGAQAFFEDKYGQVVRVVAIGQNVSTELCGGTHVASLAELKTFVLLSDEALSAGVRRLQAICGDPAIAWLKGQRSLVQGLEKQLRVAAPNLYDTVAQMGQQLSELQKKHKAQSQLWVAMQAAQADPAAAPDHSCLSLRLDSQHWAEARYAADVWKEKLPTSVVGLIHTTDNGRCRFILMSGSSSTLPLKELLAQLTEKWPTIKGGGRPGMLQAGGEGFTATELEQQAYQWLSEQD